MKKFNTLRNKLYLEFFIIPAIIISTLSGYSIYRMDRQVGIIFDDNLVTLKEVKTLLDNYAVLIVDATNKDRVGIITFEESLNLINQAEIEISQSLERSFLSKKNKEKEEKEMLDSLHYFSMQAERKIEKQKKFLKNENVEALKQSQNQNNSVIYPLIDTLREIRDLHLQIAAEEREKAHDIFQQILWLFSLLVFLTVVAASPFGYFVSQAIIGKLKNTVNEISLNARQIATASEEQEHIASNQASSVNQTTTTMDELKASSNKSAQEAEAALNTACKVLFLVELNQDRYRADQWKDRHRASLMEKVEQIADRIKFLSDQVQQINSIAELVSSLAEQTNMLAINAAVEPVRVGEYRKGFGVVAAEIRKLADRSRSSAIQINHLVGDIQNATWEHLIFAKKTLESSVGRGGRNGEN